MLNRTPEFRRSVEENWKSLPEVIQRKVSRQQRRIPSGSRGPGSGLTSKEYITEAYTILNHITSLSRMLSGIRRPYLNIDSQSSLISHQPLRNFDLGRSDEPWGGIRYLSNEERDQIDLQARIILSRCADRVKEMEIIEKKRVEMSAARSNPIMRLLPSRLVQDTASLSSDFVAAHHAGITWFLNRRLAEASQNQKEMQEERIKRQMERSKTLGSGAAKEAATLNHQSETTRNNEKSSGWLEGVNGPSSLASSFASSLTGSSLRGATIRQPTQQSTADDYYGSSGDEVEELDLTPSQIMQFETENANILHSVQDVLASVQLAESRLLDISTLQMELVTHLTRQTEVTDQLHEDAIATSAMVEKGNSQLREAKRRAKDGRKFILLFLIGASLALLFIHFY